MICVYDSCQLIYNFDIYEIISHDIYVEIQEKFGTFGITWKIYGWTLELLCEES